MSEYANKLSSLSEKKKKLLEEESRLVQERKNEIGEWAEKLNLLEMADECLVGLFLEAQKANDEIKKRWELQGGHYLNSKKSKKSKRTNSEAA